MKARLFRAGFRIRDLGFLLRHLPPDAGHLRFPNTRIRQIRLSSGERSARCFHASFSRGHGRRQLICRGDGLLALALGNCTARGQAGVGVFVEKRELVGSFLLRLVCLGRGQIRLRLPHASLRVHFGLLAIKLVLFQLLLQNRSLRLGRHRSRLRGKQRRLSLLLTGTHLLIVQNCDDVARLYRVAFAYAYLENAPGGLGSDSRVVTFDTAAQGDDVIGNRRRKKEQAPDQEPCATKHRDDDEWHRLAARFRLSRCAILRRLGVRLIFGCRRGIQCLLFHHEASLTNSAEFVAEPARAARR